MLLSLARLPRVALSLSLLATASAGCLVVNSTGGGSGGSGGGPVQAVSITPDVTMVATPGEGAGVFVEVTSAGRWYVYTTCDTNLGNGKCEFDLYLSSTSTFDNLTDDVLEGADFTEYTSDGVHLFFVTAGDFDGALFDTVPGTTVRLEAYLDGVSAPAYVYWRGDGVLHTGAPSNPVDFVPEQ